jgi:glyoxalase family protein
MSTPDISGLHHVTAVAGDPNRNLAFYAETLGLRLVKRSVNQDEPGTYHLFYGDRAGSPGTSVTFFPYPDARPGRPGAGQVGTTAFRVPDGSLSYWADRLDDRGVDRDPVRERFDERVLPFRDPDGLRLELVARGSPPAVDPWTAAVPAEHAVHGFDGVALLLGAREATADLLTAMGYEPSGTEHDRRRYRAPGDRAAVVDLVEIDTRARPGTGTVHHVAFRIPSVEAQESWRETLIGRGLRPTEVIDRKWFRSVYVREPGGVLFEFATPDPGYDVDESVADLGTSLALPERLADRRAEIERTLPALEVPPVAVRESTSASE